MSPAIEIYEKVLADVDQRTFVDRLATIDAIAETLAKRPVVHALARTTFSPSEDFKAVEALE